MTCSYMRSNASASAASPRGFPGDGDAAAERDGDGAAFTRSEARLATVIIRVSDGTGAAEMSVEEPTSGGRAPSLTPNGAMEDAHEVVAKEVWPSMVLVRWLFAPRGRASV